MSRVVIGVAFAFSVFALVLVAWQRNAFPDSLLSERMADKAIRAEKGLQNYWRSLDKRAEKTAHRVMELHRRRFESGIGTRFESAQAQNDLRSTKDWGKHGEDSRATVLHDGGKLRRGASTRVVSARFFHEATKHPLAARRALQEEVIDLAKEYAQAHADKARTEQLADAGNGLPDPLNNKMVGKEIVREAGKGLLGESLTGLVRNVFGGPRSSVHQYSATHHARAGTYHWSALGEAHWDANGDPILPKAVTTDRGLAGAGVKMSNSLNELYKDVDASKKKVSGKGEMHLVRLMDNLLYGTAIKNVKKAETEAEKQEKEVADFSRSLAEHKFDNKMLVDKNSSFFSDDEKEDVTAPDDGLLTKMLKPDPLTALPDNSRVAKKLKDSEMLVPGDKGFFKDTDDENPMDHLLSSKNSKQSLPKPAFDAKPKVIEGKEKKEQMRKLISGNNDLKTEFLRDSHADTGAAEGVAYVNNLLSPPAPNPEISAHSQTIMAQRHEIQKNTQQVRKVEERQPAKDRAFHVMQHEQRDANAAKHAAAEDKAFHAMARDVETEKQVKAKRQVSKREFLKSAFLKAEQAVVGAEKEENAESEKVRVLRREEKEREEVLAMERREVLKGEALAAKELAAKIRVKAFKRAKKVEERESGRQERHAMATYFEKLELQDKEKHKLAVSVIHREEKPRPASHAVADLSDRRDTRRDDRFFDKIAQQDKDKDKRAREKRAQHRRDQHSLAWYEDVNHILKQEQDKKKRGTQAFVPRAYKEWKHAEAALAVHDDKRSAEHQHPAKAPQRTLASHRPATVTAQQMRSGKATTKGNEGVEVQSVEAAPRLHFKEAFRSVKRKDVGGLLKVNNLVHERMTTTKTGRKITSSSTAAASTKGQEVAEVSVSSAKSAPYVDVATAKRASNSEETAKSAPKSAPYVVGSRAYDRQKRHLAKVLDTPVPTAKKELDSFLNNPIATIDSLVNNIPNGR